MNHGARDELWDSLLDLGAARRTVSRTLRRSVNDDCALIQNCLETLACLELWRVNILAELGVPDPAIRRISSFLSFLEPVHQPRVNVGFLDELGLLEP